MRYFRFIGDPISYQEEYDDELPVVGKIYPETYEFFGWFGEKVLDTVKGNEWDWEEVTNQKDTYEIF